MAENNSKETGAAPPKAGTEKVSGKKRRKPSPPETGEGKKTAPGRAPGGLVPSDPLHRYLEMVRSIPRLTREEEHELAVRVHQRKDSEAALRLVTSHLWLVVNIAFEFRTQFQNMLDLIQEGNIGLMRAIQKFDPFKGVRLPAYASYWIRAYTLKYLLDNWRLIRVGTTNTRRKLLFNLNRVTQEMRMVGIDPSPRLLAEHFDTTEDDVVAVQKSLASRDISLETPVEEGSSLTFADTIGSGAPAYEETLGEERMMEQLKKEIAEFSLSLKPSERSILENRLMTDEPQTLAEIGERFGISREAVRQAETRLMKRLKAHLEERMSGISDFSFVSTRQEKGKKH